MSSIEVTELDGGVRLLTLARPKVNAFDIDLMTALSGAMKQAGEEASCRSVVLTGSGSVFSAGLDFKAMMFATMEGPDGATRFARAMKQAFTDVWTCPRPTVAAVNGSAIAAGFLIAIACDFRFVTRASGQYGLNEMTFGAGFPPIAVEIGRQAMGRHVTTAMLGAQLFGWEAGLANGSFTHSVSDGQSLVDEAVVWARTLGAYPQEAYAHAKAQLVEPFFRRVREEPPEHAEKTAAIFGTSETVSALMAYASSMIKM
jgi:enoyl-CoA hydratase/carnithine racemase